eukprot:TRINITY_DN11718_c0_g1_i3.p6 TRINITY_DN11718_c0_g1~~TRINITY_DN11718_c0_g1_i3.p6  ORF type:complete len:107 (-),score=2.54 TRINITY_DN11718_c0_g1_i3:160-480(-)
MVFQRLAIYQLKVEQAIFFVKAINARRRDARLAALGNGPRFLKGSLSTNACVEGRMSIAFRKSFFDYTLPSAYGAMIQFLSNNTSNRSSSHHQEAYCFCALLEQVT